MWVSAPCSDGFGSPEPWEKTSQTASANVPQIAEEKKQHFQDMRE